MLASDGYFTFTRVAKLQFVLQEKTMELCLYWVNGYGGGLFLPFRLILTIFYKLHYLRDSTNGQETFGGGRYLFDSIKGADLGDLASQVCKS